MNLLFVIACVGGCVAVFIADYYQRRPDGDQ